MSHFKTGISALFRPRRGPALPGVTAAAAASATATAAAPVVVVVSVTAGHVVQILIGGRSLLTNHANLLSFFGSRKNESPGHPRDAPRAQQVVHVTATDVVSYATIGRK